MPEILIPADPAARTKEGQEHIWTIEGALERGQFFSVRTMEFIEATRKRFDQYGEKTLISVRELQWLRDLRKRCRK